MKGLLIGIFTLLALGLTAQAQTDGLKIGYTNADFILSKMPQAKQIQSELKTHEEQLGAQLDARMKEFENKYETFTKEQATMIEAVKKNRQEELQTMQASIQKFQQEAQKSIQDKQLELLKPVYAKIDETIQAVAKENGFTHVFTNEALLFASEESDISELVLAKLGVVNE
ncbi:MAG: OmpH family outer membrane protein [Cyclobacteriaceae bacterium]